ncbi:hypothetical protein MPDQ_002312 [Monascus purpureus]|uniref:Ubiquitin-like domain-containing protein n=1 Tax=Monascus purpureus TaxID=5098 RepID=A0A507QKQ2_MONPU|nr:hypothetical protein MPDQ_002312 [Monascus purpureus]BDD58915.1 hypothetical protein MAP00_004153 [Monascus purpureus]
MAELAFTKSFLSLLDSRPVKLRADHVFDPQQVGLRVPYILPRLPPSHPSMPRKTRQHVVPGSSKSITIQLRSTRNPTLELTVANAPLSTTNLDDLKETVRSRVVDGQGNKIAVEKIKLLYKRKPITGKKSVGDILADEPDMLIGGKEVEFGIMIIGAAGARVVEAEEETEEKQKGAEEATKAKEIEGLSLSAEEVLKSEAFWEDLEGFLAQRIKDEDAAKMRSLFETAWVKR